MPEPRVVASELVLGAPGSGKTARAEALAQAWLAAAPQHRAVYIATAQAWDQEMRARVERQRRHGAEPVPRLVTMEEPLELAHAIGRHGRADTLIVADCLTFWLAAKSMAAVATDGPAPAANAGARAAAGVIATALRSCAGPIVLISIEPAAGDMLAGRDLRQFLDSMGSLNQEAAAACERVTLMAAGAPLVLKGGA